MTASRVGLAILAAVALALAVLHLAAGGSAAPTSRAAFADLVAGAGPHELVWERPDQAPVAIAGGAAGWTMTSPAPGPVEVAAVTDVIDALRGARWQRRTAARADAARLVLRVDGHAIELGPEVPGVGTWIRRGDSSYLVERWVAAALDRDALALRVRAPFAAVAPRAQRIEAHGAGVDLVLAGTPLAVEDAGGVIALRADVAAAVRDHLATIHVELVLPGDPQPRPVEMSISVDGPAATTAVVRGPCPEHHELTWLGGAATGEVCVGPEPVLAFQLAARAIAAAPLDVAEPRPVTGALAEVTLASGAQLHWRGAVVEATGADGAPVAADDDATARVAAALTAPATVIRLPAPRPAARGAIRVGSETLELLGDDLLARPGASIGYRLAPDAIAALRLEASALRDRLLWRTEPSLVTAITVTDGAGPARSLAIAEPWARELAAALAAPRAIRVADTAGPIRRRFELTYAPPPTAGAEPEIHRLELGRSVADGCAATADGQALILPPALCRLLGKPSRP